jgi:hypothetical protein
MGKDQLLVKKYEQWGVQHQVGGPAGAQHTLASRILLLPDIPSWPVAGVCFQTTYLLLIFKGEGEGGSEGWWP